MWVAHHAAVSNLCFHDGMEDDISQRFESCDARLLEHDKQLHDLSQKVGVLENASKDSYKRISSVE